MATTEVMNSTNGVVMIGGTVVAELTGASLNTTHSMRNTTNKTSAGWREGLEGLREWGMSCDAMYIPNGSFSTIFAAYTGRTQLTVRWASTEADDDYYEGTAYFANGTLDSPAQEDNVVFNISFDGIGALTEGATV